MARWCSVGGIKEMMTKRSCRVTCGECRPCPTPATTPNYFTTKPTPQSTCESKLCVRFNYGLKTFSVAYIKIAEI